MQPDFGSRKSRGIADQLLGLGFDRLEIVQTLASQMLLDEARKSPSRIDQLDDLRDQSPELLELYRSPC